MRPLLLCLLAACALAACKGPANTTGNSSPPSPSPVANATTPDGARPAAEAQPPTNAEARAALERVYGRAVVVDEKLSDAFVTGDFNGDGSADLAVAVRPAPDMLGELNGEFPDWIVVDPRATAPPDPGRAAQATPPAGPVMIEPGDELLAVVHGHGPEGWRGPQATQSYLLKGVGARGLSSVRARDYPPALRVRRNLNTRADIITGQLAGADGFLYWSRGKYVWHKR